MLRKPTREDLLQKYEYLDRVCLLQSMSDSHIRVLREDIDDWKLLMPQLGLSQRDIELTDLGEQREVMKRHAALHKWKRQLRKRATYLCFLNACMKINNFPLAERMLDLLNEHIKGQPVSSQHITCFITIVAFIDLMEKSVGMLEAPSKHHRRASDADLEGEQDVLSASHTSISSRGSTESGIGEWLPIEQRLEELKMKYKFTIDTIKEYFQRNITSQMIAKRLLLMPPELRSLKDMLRMQRCDSSVSALAALLALTDYRHFEILQQVVAALGDESCKRTLLLYEEDLESFYSGTTLEEFSKVSAGSAAAPHTAVLTLGAKWESKSLLELEEFKKKLQRKSGLHPHDLQTRHLASACLRVTFTMRSQQGSLGNLTAVDSGFYRANNVLQVSVGDRTLYHVESPKVGKLSHRAAPCPN